MHFYIMYCYVHLYWACANIWYMCVHGVLASGGRGHIIMRVSTGQTQTITLTSVLMKTQTFLFKQK